jgi:hypothetical protein
LRKLAVSASAAEPVRSIVATRAVARFPSRSGALDFSYEDGDESSHDKRAW